MKGTVSRAAATQRTGRTPNRTRRRSSRSSTVGAGASDPLTHRRTTTSPPIVRTSIATVPTTQSTGTHWKRPLVSKVAGEPKDRCTLSNRTHVQAGQASCAPSTTSAPA